VPMRVLPAEPSAVRLLITLAISGEWACVSAT
jgi:hypothetical protein